MPTTPAYRLVRTAPAPVRQPQLDERQQAVVDHAGGPLLVLAGPGTGKTTTLVEAVVDRVERRGLCPEQVLVLTFSRRAATELRERILGRVARTVAEPAAFTFHSWCYALVRSFGSAPGAQPPRLLSAAERDVRLHELLVGNAAGEGTTRWPAELARALPRRGFAREVADLLDRARSWGLDAAALRRLGEATGRPAWVAAASFLDEYLSVLDARGEVDYAGLVERAVRLLADPVVAEQIARRYRAVFVDEYQDTDPAQERVLQLVAGGGRDLVVVGDPDQSIYAFRGAEVAGILRFSDRFRTRAGSPAPVLALGVSRRAGAELLAPARAVAARLPTPGLTAQQRRAHRKVTPGGPPAAAAPELRLYPTVAEEVTAIADVLRRARLQDGIPWAQMAVLVRSGSRGIPVLRRALVAAGVPVAVAADELPLSAEPAVAPLLGALRVADRGWSALSAEDARLMLLSPLGGAKPAGLRRLGRRLRELARAGGAGVPRRSTALIRDAVADPRPVHAFEAPVAGPVLRLHYAIERAAGLLRAGAPPEDALWALWDGSGWGRRLAGESAGTGPAARSANRDLDAVLALFQAAARLEERQPRGGVAALHAELAAQVLPAGPGEEQPAVGDAVRLLTAHRAKGLEWDVVVIAGVQDGVWPDLRRRGSLLEVDAVGPDPAAAVPSRQALLVEERRLFYVALTRARRRLVITAVQSVDDAGERPSRFLAETGLALPATARSGTALLSAGSLLGRLRRALVDPASSPDLQSAAAGLLAELAGQRGPAGEPLLPAADPAAWWGLAELTDGAQPVRPAGEPLGLSASAVAAYDECPLRWFLDREVRAGGAPSAEQSFGSVLHALAELVARGALPADLDRIEPELDRVWAALPFAAPWIAERERGRGREGIARLLRWLQANPRTLVAAEQEFSQPWGPDVVLRGSVDRVERDAAGLVHVVDLKTGRTPKSRDTVAADAQLGVYQVVARDGGLGSDGSVQAGVGGAELVYLTAGSKPEPTVRVQPPLPPKGEPSWVEELLERVTAGLRAETFPARPGDQCPRCVHRMACPARGNGQVVQ